MRPHFNIKMGWLILMFLLISPPVYAEQIITISEADTTFNLSVQRRSTKKIENAYPGMRLEFSPIILKNQARSTITVHLTADEQMIGQLTLTDRFRKVIPDTFKVPPSSTYEVRMTGMINESLGNEQQGQTIQLPITLDFTETTADRIASDKLPQTSESLVFSKVAILAGLSLVASVFIYKQLNRE